MGEERAFPSDGVAQEPLVGRFLSRLLFQQVELSLLADKEARFCLWQGMPITRAIAGTHRHRRSIRATWRLQ
jgi:hypothetical protein